jgi:hypothetical protein
MAAAQDAGMRRWTQGKGWGWVWGPDDEVGALNEMTDASRLAALRLVTQGRAYDLGLPYDRNSYRWPGHSPGEIMTFRTPEGVARQRDLPFATPEGATPATPAGTAARSSSTTTSPPRSTASATSRTARTTTGTTASGRTGTPATSASSGPT